MARSGPLLTEAQGKKIAPLLPPTTQAPQGWPPVDREPSCVGRDSVDSGERRCRIERICPQKKNRVRPATQDARALRRYRRRWIVERTIGWLGDFQRSVVRYDRSPRIDRAFFHIACFMIVLRRVVQ